MMKKDRVKRNAQKCKTLRNGRTQSKEIIVVNGGQMEDVEEFG